MTLECIRSIAAQTLAICYELIVLDNASTDGSADAIRREFPQLKLIASEQNVGFAQGNNIAAQHARGRRLLLLNPDTVVLDHAIDRLCEFAQSRRECRIWGGRTIFADGSLNPASCWRRATLWSIFCLAVGLTALKTSSLFNWEGYGGWKRNTVRHVDIVTGCFLLIDYDLWRQLHGFDPIFFMYGEEADLCLRARGLGARPTITPSATIIHYGGASEFSRAEGRIKVLAGRVTLLQRHSSGLVRFLGNSLYRLVPLSRWLIYSNLAIVLRREDLRKKASLWRNVWQNRDRWINGWSNAAVDSARRTASAGGASNSVG